jgi:hypothetical protein
MDNKTVGMIGMGLMGTALDGHDAATAFEALSRRLAANPVVAGYQECKSVVKP